MNMTSMILGSLVDELSVVNFGKTRQSRRRCICKPARMVQVREEVYFTEGRIGCSPRGRHANAAC